MPDGGPNCTEHTLRDLVEVMTAPSRDVAARLSGMLGALASHEALVTLASDANGTVRSGAGDPSIVDGASLLDLEERRRDIPPGSSRFGTLRIGDRDVPTLDVVSRNGALLAIMGARPQERVIPTILQIWNIVALRAQELADTAPPDYLLLARATSGVRMEALTELTDQYSTTLESVLAALRSAALDDHSARDTATGIAAGGLTMLRTASERTLTSSEEPVTSAFARLREDLRHLVRFRDLEVQLVAPPEDGRALPREVAHGARAIVRGSVLALVARPRVTRIRVQWDCDGSNLLIDLRDDGPVEVPDTSTELELARQRVHALGGRMSIEATPGWGTRMSTVIPLDPPHATPETAAAWGLRPRELEVLHLLANGRRNRAIAKELGISENTVKFHVASIFRKLGVGSRAEATALVLAQAVPVA